MSYERWDTVRELNFIRDLGNYSKAGASAKAKGPLEFARHRAELLESYLASTAVRAAWGAIDRQRARNAAEIALEATRKEIAELANGHAR